MTTRKKKTIISGVTRERAEEAFAQYAKADAQCAKITAEMELQFAKIREKWQDRLQSLTQERDEAFDVLQSFAVEHQQELFSKKKSLEMTHGVIGFRTGTPKLKTLRGFTWASALQLVRKFLPFTYIRLTEDIAKDKLLADRELSEVAVYDTPTGDPRMVPMSEAMAACGIQVVQEEAFYVEPKKEDRE